MRLLEAAKKKPQLQLVMQTICGTGIRVSELKFFTVEDVKQGEVLVNCKGKTRTILIPGKLRKLLLDYAKKRKNPLRCDLSHPKRKTFESKLYLGADESVV